MAKRQRTTGIPCGLHVLSDGPLSIVRQCLTFQAWALFGTCSRYTREKVVLHQQRMTSWHVQLDIVEHKSPFVFLMDGETDTNNAYMIRLLESFGHSQPVTRLLQRCRTSLSRLNLSLCVRASAFASGSSDEAEQRWRRIAPGLRELIQAPGLTELDLSDFTSTGLLRNPYALPEWFHDILCSLVVASGSSLKLQRLSLSPAFSWIPGLAYHEERAEPVRGMDTQWQRELNAWNLQIAWSLRSLRCPSQWLDALPFTPALQELNIMADTAPSFANALEECTTKRLPSLRRLQIEPTHTSLEFDTGLLGEDMETEDDEQENPFWRSMPGIFERHVLPLLQWKELQRVAIFSDTLSGLVWDAEQQTLHLLLRDARRLDAAQMHWLRWCVDLPIRELRIRGPDLVDPEWIDFTRRKQIANIWIDITSLATLTTPMPWITHITTGEFFVSHGVRLCDRYRSPLFPPSTLGDVLTRVFPRLESLTIEAQIADICRRWNNNDKTVPPLKHPCLQHVHLVLFTIAEAIWSKDQPWRIRGKLDDVLGQKVHVWWNRVVSDWQSWLA
jgi:hypothetical protein